MIYYPDKNADDVLKYGLETIGRDVERNEWAELEIDGVKFEINNLGIIFYCIQCNIIVPHIT